MAKKLLSETIDFCLQRWAVPKIHMLIFEGEGGDLCRLRALEKRDELWGVLGSPYTRSSWAFVPLPSFILTPSLFIKVPFALPLSYLSPFALVPLPVLPLRGLPRFRAAAVRLFNSPFPFAPSPSPLTLPFPFPFLLNYLTI